MNQNNLTMNAEINRCLDDLRKYQEEKRRVSLLQIKYLISGQELIDRKSILAKCMS